MNMNRKRPALGRGLGALLPERPAQASETGELGQSQVVVPAAAAPTGAPRIVAIERLERNPEQPRKRFDSGKLSELADSIKSQGIIQPLIVSQLSGGTYLILAGERRWRAAQLAGLHEVPVYVRETPERQRLELALIENLQRDDLNPIEESHAFERLLEEHGYTQDELAQRVGKERSTVANSLRLLKLPTKVQSMVVEGQLSMGHARALLGLTSDGDMIELARAAVEKKWSVRVIEAEVRKRLQPESTEPKDERRTLIIEELEQRLRRNLGVQVRLKTGSKPNGPGKIEVPYSDLDELNRLLQTLLGPAES